MFLWSCNIYRIKVIVKENKKTNIRRIVVTSGHLWSGNMVVSSARKNDERKLLAPKW